MEVLAWGLAALVCGSVAAVTFYNATKGGVGHNKVVHGWVITGTPDKPVIVAQDPEKESKPEEPDLN